MSSDTFAFHESVCENHPCPERPHADRGRHSRRSFTMTGGDEETVEKLISGLYSEECAACGGRMESRTVTGEWPLEDLTKDSILEMFRETNGTVVIEFYPDDRDRRFYIGEIGGRYLVETEEYGKPDVPYGIDNLVQLVEHYPNRLRKVDSTPLDAAHESYQLGEI